MAKLHSIGLPNVLGIPTSSAAHALQITAHDKTNTSYWFSDSLRDSETRVTDHLILGANSRTSSYEFVEGLGDCGTRVTGHLILYANSRT